MELRFKKIALSLQVMSGAASRKMLNNFKELEYMVNNNMSCEDSCKFGFLLGLWSMNPTTFVYQNDLESHLNKLGFTIAVLNQIDDLKKLNQFVRDKIKHKNEELEKWFAVGWYCFVATYDFGERDLNLMGTIYFIPEMLKNDPSLRKSAAGFMQALFNVDVPPEIIEKFYIDHLLPFLYDYDTKKYIFNPNMAIMLEVRHLAKVRDKELKNMKPTNQYTYTGPVGILVNNSEISNSELNVEQNLHQEQLKLPELANQLSQLRLEATKEAKEAEHHVAIGAIASAELEAKNGDVVKTHEHLKKAGKWAFDIATKIGVNLVTDTIKKLL